MKVEESPKSAFSLEIFAFSKVQSNNSKCVPNIFMYQCFEMRKKDIHSNSLLTLKTAKGGKAWSIYENIGYY